MCLQEKIFENIVGKGEIAHNEQFLLFPTVFPTHWDGLSAIFIEFEIVVWKSLNFVVWEKVN